MRYYLYILDECYADSKSLKQILRLAPQFCSTRINRQMVYRAFATGHDSVTIGRDGGGYEVVLVRDECDL